MRTDLASIALRAVVRTMGEQSPVVYHRGQVSQQVGGVFQASHVGVDPDTGVQVRSTHPVLLIDRQDLPWDPKQGDVVEVRSTSYRVRDAQPDGHTGWLLVLHKHNPGGTP